jgi:hypothetical protein
MTCPSKNGITPIPYAPTIHEDRINWFNNKWFINFSKHSDPYIYYKFELEKTLHAQPSNTWDQGRTDHIIVLLFDSEEELNIWANNCRLTDPLLIADQETWKTAHGITFTYEYYSLSPTTGPDPII